MPRKFETRISTAAERHDTDLVTVYRRPEKDTRYTIGADAATGFGDDYTALQVWSNRIPFEQVAWLRNKRITTYRGSEVLYALARYYNNALVVPERRHPGNAYIDNLLEKEAYGRIYQPMQTLDESPSQSSKYGIATTDDWKALLINTSKALIENIAETKVIFHDEITLVEFCNFIWDVKSGRGKAHALEGSNDDTVMAAMLALYGCSEKPQKPRPQVRLYDAKNENIAHQQYLMKKHFARLTKDREYAGVTV